MGLSAHRQGQRVLAVVEGVLEHHGGQHAGGAVVVPDVVLKVLLRGKAADCEEHWSSVAQSCLPHSKNLDSSFICR